MQLDRKSLEGLFKSIASHLSSEVRIFVMGKAYMVIEGFFPSTDTLDCIFVSKKELEAFELSLASVGFRKGQPENEDFGLVGFYQGEVSVSLFLLERIGKGIAEKSRNVKRFGKLDVSIIDQQDIISLLGL